MYRSMIAGLVAVSLAWACAAPAPEESADVTAEAQADPRAQFLGAWKLVSIERRSPEGEVIPPEEDRGTPLGYIMYDLTAGGSGVMGVVIQQANRATYAGDEPTPEETLAALSSYTAYHGGFSVDEAEGVVTHHLEASVNPSGAGSDYRRHFTFSGNRLTLQPPAGPSGNTVHLTWERLPRLPSLSPEHERFVGFWRFAKIERGEVGGEPELVDESYQNGFIIYTDSGHMAVHLVRPDRPLYAGDQPTAEEAQAALRTYISYFGPVTLHPDEGYIVHHREGCWVPTCMGSDAQRFYEMSDRQLVLKPPPTTDDEGREMQSRLTWQRLSE